MPLLERLSEVERSTLLNYPALEHDDAPSAPLRKPLSQATLAVVTTAGLHLRDDAPFRHGAPPDHTYRVIPSDTPPAEIVQSHTSIGFDRTGVYRDLNVTLPLERVRELVAVGEVGALAPRVYSFLGAQRDPRRTADESAPEVARRLLDDGVDAVLLTPT
ncbi:MAG: glycine/sarcosine/betaine reductase selenoprotein B family protein [Chloroflexota bacterium]|nr:glycine/sarcosine/betaine reductase selenoprotein B family protein [Chloroflexota bacterium]